jgi:hypothetical protein
LSYPQPTTNAGSLSETQLKGEPIWVPGTDVAKSMERRNGGNGGKLLHMIGSKAA